MPIATIICKLNLSQCRKLLNHTTKNNPICCNVTTLRDAVRNVFATGEVSVKDIREIYFKA